MSVIPFLIFIFLLIIRKRSLLFSSIFTLIAYTVLVISYWAILPSYLYASYGKGFLVALDIFIIVFGAIFFLKILEDLKIIKNISYYLESFSKDYRVQIIVIAWFFSSLLEGTAGFGIPAAVAVPLLVGVGLSPIKALIVGLLGNSTAGVFGAVGTPIRVGFSGFDSFLIPFSSALLNFVGIIVPIFMLWTITSGRLNRKKEFLDALPFAIWSGLLFTIPSFFSVFLGQEFPSIVGSAVGLILIIISIRFKIFTPRENLSLCEEKEITHNLSLFKSFFPYILLVLFLILGKVFIGNIGIPLSFGFNHTFSLFNPGFVFIIVGLLVLLIWKKYKIVLFDSIKKAIKGSIHPFLVIISMSVIAQIMINSGHNLSGIPAVIDIIANGFESKFLPLFTPFVGAFGSFLTGSVTVSNIMFGNILVTAGGVFDFETWKILSLCVVGAAAGNMIALADMLTAEAVIGVKNAERQILKGVFIPCFVYLLIIGLIGYFIL